jgi:hypothetical protein
MDNLDDLAYLTSCRVFHKRSALMRAVRRKNLRAVTALCRMFSYTKQHVCRVKNGKCVLDTALQSQSVKVATFLFDTFAINKEDVLAQGDPCFSKRKFMQFILQRFEFCGQELRATFDLAVENDQLWLIRILFEEHPQVTPDLVEIVSRASYWGRLDVLHFLRDRHDKPELLCMARGRGGYYGCALIAAASSPSGHSQCPLDIIKCLHTDFGLTAEDVVQGGLWAASKRENGLDIMRYFFFDMGLKATDITTDVSSIQYFLGGAGPCYDFLVSQGVKFN